MNVMEMVEAAAIVLSPDDKLLIAELQKRIRELEAENKQLEKEATPPAQTRGVKVKVTKVHKTESHVRPRPASKNRRGASATSEGASGPRGDRVFTCSCGREFSNGQALGGHRAMCNSSSKNSKGFACSCGRVFSSGQALGGHRGKCTANATSTNRLKAFYCSCGRKFANGQALGGHRGKCPLARDEQEPVMDVDGYIEVNPLPVM